VKFADQAGVDNALKLNGTAFKGRNLKVRPMIPFLPHSLLHSPLFIPYRLFLSGRMSPHSSVVGVAGVVVEAAAVAGVAEGFGAGVAVGSEGEEEAVGSEEGAAEEGSVAGAAGGIEAGAATSTRVIEGWIARKCV
jgi:hypothetical protein